MNYRVTPLGMISSFVIYSNQDDLHLRLVSDESLLTHVQNMAHEQNKVKDHGGKARFAILDIKHES